MRSYLEKALASGAEPVGLGGVETQLGEHDVLAVAGLRGHGGVDVDRPSRLGGHDDVLGRPQEVGLAQVLDQLHVRALAHAPRVLVGALVRPLRVELWRRGVISQAMRRPHQDEGKEEQ